MYFGCGCDTILELLNCLCRLLRNYIVQTRKGFYHTIHKMGMDILWASISVHLQNCENRLLACSCLSVCPPARPGAVEQLGSRWMDVHKI